MAATECAAEVILTPLVILTLIMGISEITTTEVGEEPANTMLRDEDRGGSV